MRGVEAFWAMLIVLALVFVVALSIFHAGRSIGQAEMRQEALDRGLAEYDSTNGQWKWKD